MNIRSFMCVFLALMHSTFGFYIKPTVEKANNKNVIQAPEDDWQVFQKKLGLTKQTVELLKAQKDQPATKDLLKRFMKENPQFVTKSAEQPKKDDQFSHFYRKLVTLLKMSKSMLKTSVNFELADGPLKDLKRSRRKIAIKMVSDMPSQEIDSLLHSFYQMQGKHQTEYNTANDDALDYGDVPPLTDFDPDYMYDNFYDDGADVALSAQSRQNSEYGSFQDLILQVKHNQWEQESEERKLNKPINEHFV